MTAIPKPPKRQPRPRKRISRRQSPRPQRKGAAAEKRRAEHAKWRAAVMRKNGGRCAYSAMTATDAAHVFPKGRYPHLRSVVANGIPLSREVHEFFTRRPVLWLDFARDWMGPRAFGQLQRRALERRA